MSNPSIDAHESYLPLSKSAIWQDARNYYQGKGVSAWKANAVPNYITTNPYIAQSYARVIDSFFEIHRPARRRKEATDDTRYILELGAGSGRFAYHFLKTQFSDMQNRSHSDRKTVYVMTEISTSTIDFWRNHSQLAPFVAQGLLDFANFNVLEDEKVELIVSGKTLDASVLDTPMAVIANYVIDSLPHDLFAIRDGQLLERLIRYEGGTNLQTTSSIDYFEQPCTLSYYGRSDWNQVLKQYLASFNDLNLALPVGGFRMLETLSKLSKKPVFLLSSDFGATSDLALQQLGPRRIAVNGAYSIHVNYNALKRYAEMSDMQVLSCDAAKASLETMGVVIHPGKRSLAPLHHGFASHILMQGPDEFFMMKKIAEKSCDDLSLQNIIALIRVSNYDSRIFDICLAGLEKNLDDIDPWSQKALIEVLMKVEDMHYRYEQNRDPTLKILNMLLKINAMEAARVVAQRYISILKETPAGRLALAQIFTNEAAEK